jgi:L-threonylcarbamoyladenylate synthase
MVTAVVTAAYNYYVSYETKRFDSHIEQLLMKGGVGVLPSDTIYGLSCRAMDQDAVEKLRRLKARDKTKPFIVLFSNLNQLTGMGILATDAAQALRYWPGKLTVICQAALLPQWLHVGTDTIAIRQPSYPELLALMERVGPLISTSVNLQGGQHATTISTAKQYFGDQVDFYVNGGHRGGRPSTLVKPVFFKLKIIRSGAVRIRKEDRA